MATLCLVTDRRRLPDGSTRALVDLVHNAIAAGVDLIQVRERDLEARELAALVTAMLAIARGTATRILVNDRLDIALACGAHGVHLRGDSIAAADARRIAPPPFVIGRSVHSVAEAVAAAGADYLVAGTVFPTASKPSASSWLGVDGLRAIVRAAAVPVLAIGGMTLDRLPEVATTGAAGIAAIGLFQSLTPGDIASAARRSFDSVKTHP